MAQSLFASALCLACVHGIVKMPTGQHCVFCFSANCRTFTHQPRTDCKPARRSFCASCDCRRIVSSSPDNRRPPRIACRSRHTQRNALRTRRDLPVPDATRCNTGRPVPLCFLSGNETLLTPSRISHPRGHVRTQCRATTAAENDNRKRRPVCCTDQCRTGNADRVSQCRADCPQLARQLFLLRHWLAPLAVC